MSSSENLSHTDINNIDLFDENFFTKIIDPNFDILKFLEHINKSLLQIKEIVSNVDDAIKIIEDAVKLFCNNYDKYLKHMIQEL